MTGMPEVFRPSQAAAEVDPYGAVAAAEGGSADAPRHPRHEAAATVPAPTTASTAADATAAAPDAAGDIAAYEESLSKAFGGRRGLLDLGLPGLLFVAVYTPTRDMSVSLWASLGLAVVFTVVRLLRRETLQHSLSGLAFVALCALLAAHTGRPVNFFLPDVIINAAFLPLFAVTALLRWPIVGLLLGPITGENLAWRQVPERARAFTISTWLLAAVFAIRLAIEVPLYVANDVTALGVVHTITAYPLYAAAVYGCWRVIRKAPPPARTAAPAPDGDAAQGVAWGASAPARSEPDHETR